MLRALSKRATISIATLLLACTAEEVGPRPVDVDRSARPARLTGGATSGNRKIKSYRLAKKKLRQVYRKSPRTLYCGCAYEPGRMRADKDQCRYAPRSMRVNWEHVVPASQLGRRRASWSGKDARCLDRHRRGRDCARMIDPEFNRMEGDLYNLFPSLMDLNKARGSLPPGEVKGEKRAFGGCDFEIGNGRVEPAPAVRGDIARTYLYMDEAYPDAKLLPVGLRRVIEQWAEQDPVDRAECARAVRIERIQGNVNRFVADACRARGLKGR